MNKQYLKPEQKAFLETIANRLRGEEREKMQEIIDRLGDRIREREAKI